MKRLLKIVGIIVGIIVVLLIALGVYLAVFFDPNNYKDRISQAVQEATGRTLVIEGDLKLTVFPWLGVDFGAVRLSNPVGFTAPGVKAGDDFLSLKGGKGYVALMPLISGNVEISEIVIDGLTCVLARTADGKANWDFSKPGAPAEVKPRTEAPAPAEKSSDPMQMLKTFGLSNLSVLNATVTLNDQVEKIQAKAENITLELKGLDLKPTQGNLGAALDGLTAKAAALAFNDAKNKIDAQVKDFAVSASAIAGDQSLNVKAGKADAQLGQLSFTDAGAGQKAQVSAFTAALSDLTLTPDKKIELAGADVKTTLLQYSAGQNKLDARVENLSAGLRAIRFVGPEDISVTSVEAKAGLVNYANPPAGQKAHVESLDAQVKDFFKGKGVDVRLGSFSLNSPNIAYADTAQKLDVAIQKIAATIKDFAPGRKPRANISASVDSKNPDVAGDIKLSLAANEASADKYGFRDVAMDYTPKRGLISPDLGPVALRGNIDIAPKTLDIAFNPLSVSSQHGSLEGTGTASGGKSSLQGSFKVSAAPAALLKALNMAVATQDPKALGKLDASFSVKASPGGVDIPDLKAKLDDTNIQGAVSAALGTNIKANAQLAVDAINLDRDLPPAGSAGSDGSAGSSGAGGKPGGASGAGAAKTDSTAEMKKTLNRLDAQAKITVGSLTVSKVPLTNIVVELLADKGLITVSPANLTLAGGTVAATLKADARQAATRSNVTVKVNNVDIGEVQRLAMGKDYVASKATADIALNAAGDSPDAIKRTLGGQGSLALSKGVLNNITLVPQQVPGIPHDWMAKTGQVFDGMTATFTAENGVFTNKDMKFLSALCDIAGEGTADLPKNLIDYRMTLSFGKTTHLPARLSGPLDSPNYSIDPSGLIKGVLEDPTKLLQGIEDIRKPQDALRNLLPGGSGGAAGGATGGTTGGAAGSTAPDAGAGKGGAAGTGAGTGTDGSGGTTPAKPTPRDVLRDILK